MIEKQSLSQIGNKFEARQLLKSFQKRAVGDLHPGLHAETREASKIEYVPRTASLAKTESSTVIAALERAATLIETSGERVRELEQTVQGLEQHNAKLLQQISDTCDQLDAMEQREHAFVTRAEEAEAEVALLKKKISQLSAHPISESAQLARLIRAVDACLAPSGEKGV